MTLSGIALTGLRTSQMRLTASASNVANAASTGDAASVHKARHVEQAPLADGGTTARIVAGEGHVLRYEPGARQADAQGMVAAPDVDLVDEAVEQMMAVQSFKANVKVIAAADEMARSSLELWG